MDETLLTENDANRTDLVYNLTRAEWEKLSPREQRVKAITFRQETYRHQHAGHEKMHAEMAYLILLTLIASQFLLFYWKKRSPKTYDLATFIGMLFVPILLSIHFQLYRFLAIWFLYASLSLLVLRYSSLKPLPQHVSRWVYKWFYFAYKISYLIGTLGYLLIALNPFLGMVEAGFSLLGYGIYFGTVTRDFAELIAVRMASTIGYVSKDGIPLKSFDPHVCSLCGDDLNEVLPPNMSFDPNSRVFEQSHQLNCGHIFHDFCIRGWCLIGKKDVCPYCKEKVDLKLQFPNPWALQDVYFGHFLDLARYFIVWQPIIIILTEAEINLFHLR